MKALLYIDNAEDMAAISGVLRLAHIQVIPANDIFKALDRWTEYPADLIIMAQPADDTESAVKQLRLTTDVPVLAIVDGLTEARCLGLYKIGVDLVIMRPYSPRVLRAQAEIMLKRGLSIPLTQIPTVQLDGIAVDPRTRCLTKEDGAMLVLTQREFQLFYFMWLHRGQILTNEQIIEAIWGYTGRGDKNMLRSLVNRVRRKIEPTPDNPRYLVTVSGVGYQFAEVA